MQIQRLLLATLVGTLTAVSGYAQEAEPVDATGDPPDRGDRIERRLDRRGDGINRRLDAQGERLDHRYDVRGDNLEERYDKRADRAREAGNDELADRLDVRGDNVDERFDRARRSSGFAFGSTRRSNRPAAGQQR